MYGNLTRDAVLAFISQICVLVQQTEAAPVADLGILKGGFH